MKSAPPPIIRDRRFANMMCARADDGGSGILTANRGKLRRLFCLEKGWLVFATSNLIEEQFTEYLARVGALSPEMAANVTADSARMQTKPAAYMLALKDPPEDILKRSMEGLVRELMTSTLEWPDGTYEFEAGQPRLEGEIRVRLMPRSLVLAHAKRYPAALDALHLRIGPPDFRPVFAPSSDDDAMEFDALGTYVVSRCDGNSRLGDIVRDSPEDEETTLRAIYGFLLAGILHPEDPTARKEREARAREDALSREECVGRLAMAEGHDHYGVLGVDRMARVKVIREAYYTLARRYHPDRFRSGPLSDLLPRFEDFFRLVTDAYNTLADKSRRADYDAELAAARVSAGPKDADTGYLARRNYLRGRALAAQKKYTEAVTFLENAISQDAGQAEFHLELGVVLGLNPRHREQAEQRLLRALELSPALVGGYVALGHLYHRAGKVERAARMAREALRWEPGHTEAEKLLSQTGNAPDDTEPLTKAVFGTSHA